MDNRGYGEKGREEANTGLSLKIAVNTKIGDRLIILLGIFVVF